MLGRFISAVVAPSSSAPRILGRALLEFTPELRLVAAHLGLYVEEVNDHYTIESGRAALRSGIAFAVV